jgi:hypothetical protein
MFLLPPNFPKSQVIGELYGFIGILELSQIEGAPEIKNVKVTRNAQVHGDMECTSIQFVLPCNCMEVHSM